MKTWVITREGDYSVITLFPSRTSPNKVREKLYWLHSLLCNNTEVFLEQNKSNKIRDKLALESGAYEKNYIETSCKEDYKPIFIAELSTIKLKNENNLEYLEWIPDKTGKKKLGKINFPKLI